MGSVALAMPRGSAVPPGEGRTLLSSPAVSGVQAPLLGSSFVPEALAAGSVGPSLFASSPSSARRVLSGPAARARSADPAGRALPTGLVDEAPPGLVEPAPPPILAVPALPSSGIRAVRPPARVGPPPPPAPAACALASRPAGPTTVLAPARSPLARAGDSSPAGACPARGLGAPSAFRGGLPDPPGGCGAMPRPADVSRSSVSSSNGGSHRGACRSVIAGIDPIFAVRSMPYRRPPSCIFLRLRPFASDSLKCGRPECAPSTPRRRSGKRGKWVSRGRAR